MAIDTMYLNQEDAEDSNLEQGWYYETSHTENPEGPYASQYAAEQAAIKSDEK